MCRNFIVLIFFSLFIFINGQADDDRNYPIARYLNSRTSKASFDTEFPQGRCPQRFYQLGDECVYFGIDGKAYAWKQVERICARRIARILDQPSSSNIEQPNMQPVKGVRQLVLNTPQKTELLRALYRDYYEQNFALRLPYDYNTLQRCIDGKDDKWPHYCPNTQPHNSTCFESTTHGENDICLREVDCNKRYLRLACEFTLPGSAELTDSKFRSCPAISGRRRLPRWAWISIIIGSTLLALTVLLVIFAFLRKSKRTTTPKKKFLPEPRQAEEKTIRVTTKREDPAAEPMLVRATPTNISDTDYLQPRSSSMEKTANA